MDRAECLAGRTWRTASNSEQRGSCAGRQVRVDRAHVQGVRQLQPLTLQGG
jgi:hypothetical protein